MTVKEYIRRKENLIHNTYIIKSNGESFYNVNGNLIPSRDYEKENELPVSLLIFKKDNFDTTKDWMKI